MEILLAASIVMVGVSCFLVGRASRDREVADLRDYYKAQLLIYKGYE